MYIYIYIYLIDQNRCIMGCIGQKTSKTCPKLKERFVEEISRSLEKNSYRNIVKNQTKVCHGCF